MALSFIFERIIKTKRAIDIRTAGCMDDGRCGEKEGGAGNPGCLTKMDNATEGLAYGSEPLYQRVR